CSKLPDLRVSELKTEGLVNPIGIHVKVPRLSWIIESTQKGEKQTAYNILVASSKENLDKNIGDLWNSQKVKSEKSVSVSYGGDEPASGTEAFWKVKVWNAEGRESLWSPTGRWSVGLLNPDDWEARWIGLDKASGNDRPDEENRVLSARYLRKEFQVQKPVKRAMAYIVGLGVYELYMNGEKVGDHVLSPGLTEYPKRSFYIAYDITSMVEEGDNTVGTILGNGRYFAPRFKEPTLTVTYGYPKMLLQITVEYEDGSNEIISNDETWRISTDGPILENNEYDGEYYDARKEMPGWNRNGFDDSGWLQAEIVKKPSEIISAQMTEPIRITETIKPVALSSPQPGVYIFDMGQNMVGWTRLTVEGSEGTIVKQRFAETLKEDGTLYLDNIRGAKVTNTYITKGKGTETFEPRFVFQGFRYVELTGYPDTPDLSTIAGKVVHDDLELVGSFECSDDLINRIYKNAYWGIRGNYRSIPTDCPQRDERQGWLGDRAAGSRGESYMFNISNLYSKWLVDIFDAQKETGSISDVCPAYWPFYNDNV
ncbi:MAG: family 78 glycoside hydrolase catalytic domain, partial [Bacteroidales bacterium]|nr:family 78 glycoside hydrolase catalytic domain [Bacteroidales bacterium]